MTLRRLRKQRQEMHGYWDKYSGRSKHGPWYDSAGVLHKPRGSVKCKTSTMHHAWRNP